MNAGLTPQQWTRVLADAERWWAGELGRPLIQVRLAGRPVTGPPPVLPAHPFVSFYAPEVPAERIVERWDYDLRATQHLGDAFPHVFPNLGPGVLAAFLGAELTNGPDTVWFEARRDRPVESLRFQLDPDHPWLRRCCDVIVAAQARWQGGVQIGLTDLGGNLDILSTFRPAERLLYDLYDHPEEVERLTWEAHRCWWQCYEMLTALTAATNPGTSTWAPVLATEPHYMLQCDFCYMLGPEMFDRFVLPELRASARRLARTCYHLDGKGQLTHLDRLLEQEAIQAIQWVPGAGAPTAEHWPEVYRRITAAGKRIHVASNLCERPFEILDVLAEQLGRVDHIVYTLEGDLTAYAQAAAMLRRHGVPLCEGEPA